MLKIAHIFPIANQELYRDEDYVMILAHLVKKGLYNPAHFRESQYIIMDNGLYENEQVSTGLADCIAIAENSGIPVKEIIIPDAVNDLEETQKLFMENLSTVKQYQDKYTFMYVAQANTYEELAREIDFINTFSSLNLSVGISKLTPLDRGSREAIEIYTRCKFPIHFLGIKKTFSEILPVCELIRGCDTSQIAFASKNGVATDIITSKMGDPISYTRNGEDIDLEHDVCNSTEMGILRILISSQLRSYNILL